MKTILVPTDFSEVSEHAVQYACNLAKKLGSSLLLLHSFAPELHDDDRLSAEENLRLQALEVEKAGIAYKTINITGTASDAILSTVRDTPVDLVVMGVNDPTDFSRALLGSITLHIIEKAPCPVIAVPLGAGLDIAHISYATDLKHYDMQAIGRVLQIARPFGSQLNILHVVEQGKPYAKEKKEFADFMAGVNDLYNYTNFSFQLLEAETVEEGLVRYMGDNAADLLVMSTHHRNIFEKIFSKSITREVAFDSLIPVMAFHVNRHSDVKLFNA